MKTKLFFIAALLLSFGAKAQEISSTHAFAIGSPDGVTIQWDAFGDETITGCAIYKKLTQSSPLQLITPEVLVSTDSLFSYFDAGEFDPIFPPFYEIHVVTNSGSAQINECYGFKSIDFEVLDADRIRFSLTPWNQDTCCSYVKVFQNDIFMVDTDYNDSFQTIIDLSLLAPGDVLQYALMDNEAGEYERSRITYSYLQHLSQTLGINRNNQADVLSQNSPNPFSTETTIRFDLKENSMVSLKVFSIDGRWIETLISKPLMPGLHNFTFSKGNLKPGVYLYRLTSGREASVRRMVIN
jgi:hypothetical protein